MTCPQQMWIATWRLCDGVDYHAKGCATAENDFVVDEDSDVVGQVVDVTVLLKSAK